MKTLKYVVEIKTDTEGATLDYEFLKEDNQLLFLEKYDADDVLQFILGTDSQLEESDVHLTFLKLYKELYGDDYQVLYHDYKEECEADMRTLSSRGGLADYIIHYGGYRDKKELLTALCEAYNCVFDTVGYSPWSYYLATKNLSSSYIQDIYEGWNFYHLIINEVLEDGTLEEYDSVMVYASDEKQMKEWIEYSIGDDYLIDNDSDIYDGYFKGKRIDVMSETRYYIGETYENVQSDEVK